MNVRCLITKKKGLLFQVKGDLYARVREILERARANIARTVNFI